VDVNSPLNQNVKTSEAWAVAAVAASAEVAATHVLSSHNSWAYSAEEWVSEEASAVVAVLEEVVAVVVPILIAEQVALLTRTRSEDLVIELLQSSCDGSRDDWCGLKGQDVQAVSR